MQKTKYLPNMVGVGIILVNLVLIINILNVRNVEK